jgi:hypothetical protein
MASEVDYDKGETGAEKSNRKVGGWRSKVGLKKAESPIYLHLRHFRWKWGCLKIRE